MDPPSNHATAPSLFVPAAPPVTPIDTFPLPGELIGAILAYLPPRDLARVARVCRALREHALADWLWQRLVQANVPGVRVTRPYPCASFRALYVAHEPRWFVPRRKIWIGSSETFGKVVLARYDPRRGCIEGYQLLAVSNHTTHDHSWPLDERVVVQAFQPELVLHRDRPVLQLDVAADAATAAAPASLPSSPLLASNFVPLPNTFGAGPTHSAPDEPPPSNTTTTTTTTFSPASFARAYETRMRIGSGRPPDPFRHDFLLARAVTPSTTTTTTASSAAASTTSSTSTNTTTLPAADLWPPPTVPAPHRVLRPASSTSPFAPYYSHHDATGALLRNRPRDRAEMSTWGFHTRAWMGPASQYETFAALDPAHYTPTPTKVFRGIWVGDYSGHGCEFLLVHQPDEEGEDVVDSSNDNDDDDNNRIYRGRLEAIKLTGDPNVPRGECTFVADDLGDGGLDCVLAEPPFAGVRVVKSRGHVAHTGFRNDCYMESRLLLISPDRLAQFWVGFEHISFFERVNIDQFLTP
ncbi:F-box domain-containing protein [Niveomyces insectorum RCEF 264]|uniref:F-box domain-containing protein n=1 Tax=Niveomyces insectorum RCEF 264 TaxID=1081102 RepID=A0A167MZX6_9HYPO|nr:F-box domain-containing protein [Niveomyces insectorum RCEF 264]